MLYVAKSLSLQYSPILPCQEDDGAERKKVDDCRSLIREGSFHEIVLVHALLLFRLFGAFSLFGGVLAHIEIH